MLFRISLLSLLITLSWTLTTKLDNYEQFCTWKKLPLGVTYSGSYVVSGFGEDKVTTMVFTPSSRIVYRNDGKSEGKFDLTVDEEGEYRVCFRSGDRQEKFVSFDLVVSGDSQAKTGAASAKQVTDINELIKDAQFLLRKIARNQYFQNTRENVHMTNIQGLESKIHWSTFFKIFVLIVITGSQILVVNKLLKKRNHMRV